MRAIHHAPSTPASTSVRPALALAALALGVALLAGVGVGVRHALLGRGHGAEGDDTENGAENPGSESLENPDNPGVFSARVRDPGAAGSVRDAWAQAGDEARTAPEVPPFVLQFTDPQLARFERTFEDGAAPPFADAVRTGTVQRASGVSLPPGTACEVRVLPAADGPYNCTIRVRCGDVLLYPDRSQQAGFVACEVDDGQARRAHDEAPSARDGDPRVSFDVERGVVTVGDDDPARHVTIALDPGARPARPAL